MATTKDSVLVYQRYREQRGNYWTVEKLESWHWQWLYRQVSTDYSLLQKKRLEARTIAA